MPFVMFDWRGNRVCLAEGPAESYALLAIMRARRLARHFDGRIAESETVIRDDGNRMRAFPLATVIADAEGLRSGFEAARMLRGDIPLPDQTSIYERGQNHN